MYPPELLVPAKNLERLKVAITYGADAVYVGGQNYGLRARADNFTNTELAQGVDFAHRHGAKVYLTLNAFLHDADFEGLVDYCRFLEAIGVDAAIVSDLGVIRTLQSASNLDIHLSTQASCLNASAAKLWERLGIKRLIVGRELSVAEAGAIRNQANIDVEMFVHGAMCMAYSGHCTISNFTAGRDSNRGGCIQSCRLPYQISDVGSPSIESSSSVWQLKRTQVAFADAQYSDREAVLPLSSKNVVDREPQTFYKTFMSSKDLWGIDRIEAFFNHQICSLKIEGRMKSSFYVAVTCKAYRQLIDAYAQGSLDEVQLTQIAAELESVPHRDYCSGSLAAPAGHDSVFGQLSGINTGSHQYLGLVMETTPETFLIRLVEPLSVGDEVEVLPVQGEAIGWQIQRLFSVTGKPLAQIRNDSVVGLARADAPAAASAIGRCNVLRKRA